MDLVSAWRAWDRRPSDYGTAGRFEDSIQAEAKRLGIRAGTLRDRLMEQRRQGMTHGQAWKQVQRELGGSGGSGRGERRA